jgi:hypothetical protein
MDLLVSKKIRSTFLFICYIFIQICAPMNSCQQNTMNCNIFPSKIVSIVWNNTRYNWTKFKFIKICNLIDSKIWISQTCYSWIVNLWVRTNERNKRMCTRTRSEFKIWTRTWKITIEWTPNTSWIYQALTTIHITKSTICFQTM